MSAFSLYTRHRLSLSNYKSTHADKFFFVFSVNFSMLESPISWPKGQVKMAKTELAKILIESVKEIASISDHRPPMKTHCAHLSRRLKLLLPMLEEIRDCKNSLPEESMMKALLSLRESLLHAKDLLIYISQLSKIYLVRENKVSFDSWCYCLSGIQKRICSVLFFLMFCLYDSFKVLERDQVMVRFQKVTALLEQALSEIPYQSLEISDELQEQVHRERNRFFVSNVW